MNIKTNRLIITDFTTDMAQDVHVNSLDEDTRRFLPDEVFETKEDAEETIEALIGCYGDYEEAQVHPILLKDGSNIGYVELIPLDVGLYEIGYHIAEKHTGNDYATEAVNAFLPIMAKAVGVNEIWGICVQENVASIRVMQKCGFAEVFVGKGKYQGKKQPIIKMLWKA